MWLNKRFIFITTENLTSDKAETWQAPFEEAHDVVTAVHLKIKK
jgi:hypothetical protein